MKKASIELYIEIPKSFYTKLFNQCKYPMYQCSSPGELIRSQVEHVLRGLNKSILVLLDNESFDIKSRADTEGEEKTHADLYLEALNKRNIQADMVED
jgi:hypothetical protein